MPTINDVAQEPCLTCWSASHERSMKTWCQHPDCEDEKGHACKTCNGTGLRFPMLSEECPSCLARDKQERHEQLTWVETVLATKDECHGTGRIVTVTLERSLPYIQQFSKQGAVIIRFEKGKGHLVRIIEEKQWCVDRYKPTVEEAAAAALCDYVAKEAKG